MTDMFFLWTDCDGMVIVTVIYTCMFPTWVVAADYRVELCIYAVASLTWAGGPGCWFDARSLHELSKYVLCCTPPVDVWRVSQVPNLPKGRAGASLDEEEGRMLGSSLVLQDGLVQPVAHSMLLHPA